MQQQSTTIKTRGICQAELVGASLYLGWFVFMFVLYMLFLVLEQFFPSLEKHQWILVAPICFPLAILLLGLLSLFYKVKITEQTVLLSWLGIPLRKLSAASLQLFCAVGDERENVLCLTSRTVEEMSLLAEQSMLRNYFTKHDLPFIKRKHDWQDVLARKYLLHILNSPLGIFQDRKILLMKMDPVVAHQIRQLYPKLPCKNYTITPGDTAYSFKLKEDIASYVGAGLGFCETEIQDGEAIYRQGKKVVRKISLQNIQTIVCVDLFYTQQRAYPRHAPILVLSACTPEEMANKATKSEEDPLLQAYRYAERETKRLVGRRDTCSLQRTTEAEAQLRARFPHAQWIDISDSWRSDRP